MNTHTSQFRFTPKPLALALCAIGIAAAMVACGGGSSSSSSASTTTSSSSITWTYVADPTPAKILGGPWTLTQLASGNPSVQASAPFLASGKGVNVSWNYCSSGGLATNTSATPVNMQPYYFPHVIGDGMNLQGYFDYRPKDLNEAIVAASSSDGGKTWTYQQQAFMRWPLNCPKDSMSNNQWGLDAPGGGVLDGDAGYGHPNHITVGGVTRLYVVDRDYRTSVSTPPALNAAIDNLGLIVYPLSSDPKAPLTGMNAVAAVQDGSGNYSPYAPSRTNGLISPDGIMAVLPGTSPVSVLYTSKIKGGDNTGATALPAAQQCGPQPYNATGTSAPKKANHDLVTIRLATTTDGVNFVDQGAVSGLNDPTSTDFSQLRYVAPNGTLIDLGSGHYGLFYAGGNCMDADSDGFHIIGYAENVTAGDLTKWKVINGIDNPIASIESKTFVNPTTKASETHPVNKPVVGNAQSWFAGRVYSPSATRLDSGKIALTFSGYGVQSPNSDLLNYRQIGNVVIQSSAPLQKQQQ